MSDRTVPVLILGGQENSLSLARSFGRRRVPVYLAAPTGCLAVKSRYCRRAWTPPAGLSQSEFWNDLMLRKTPPELFGSVVFAGSDEAVQFLAENQQALSTRFRLDDARPDIHLAMLNKQATLELAKRAGCPTPGWYSVDSLRELRAVESEVRFPIMIKPLHSHLFQQCYPGKKYLVAEDREALRRQVGDMLEQGLQLMLTELIPGPDDLQSSYFTYRTADGRELFQYTHQIVRRFPRNSGSGCLHISKWLPDTAAMGQRFFEGIGFQGMGHVEFKLDRRDGQLKIIECNPRMSAAQAVATRSGLDMAWLIYDYLLGGEPVTQAHYRDGVRRWWFLLDCRAFRELHKSGDLGWREWLESVKGPPLVFPYFALDDPWPFVLKAWEHLSFFTQRRVKSLCQTAKEFPI